jgi:FkbM family methyltransferase
MSLRRMARLPRSVAVRTAQEVKLRRFRAAVRVEPRAGQATLGTHYGGYTVPETLDAGSVVYLAGVGKDITFDLALIARYGCTVHAFDPVPEAIAYARAATGSEPRFVLHDEGLWSSDGKLRFYDHPEPGYISHSATNMHETSGGFEATVRSVDSIMKELGHDHVDLLKLSVEGSEYEIVRDVVAKQIDVRTLCVEFSQPAPLEPALETVALLQRAGFVTTAASLPPYGWKLSFARS